MALVLSALSAALRIEDAAGSVDGLLQAVFGLGLVSCLVLSQREFVAAPNPRSARRALTTSGLCVLASMLAGLGWAWAARGRVRRRSLASDAARACSGRADRRHGTGPVRDLGGRRSRCFAAGLPGNGHDGGRAVFSLLRAHGPSGHMSRDDESRLRELLAGESGGDSLGYFALRRDRSVRSSGLTHRLLRSLDQTGLMEAASLLRCSVPTGCGAAPGPRRVGFRAR
jgi:hypothetical protein